MSTNDITPPPSSDGDRGTISAEQLQTIVKRAYQSAEGQATTIAGQIIAQDQVAADHETVARDNAAKIARGTALTAHARMDGIKSAATVGTGVVAGFMVGGPIGAIVGCAAGWVFDRFNDPYGR